MRRRAGRRDGLGDPHVRALAASDGVGRIVGPILGEGAFPIRAILFNKTPTSNWPVAWHQDVMIPLFDQRPVEGFDAWSSKGGVLHARPPAHVLEAMLAVRIDLDGSSQESGALRVLPGTHGKGILSHDAISECVRHTTPIDCVVPAGGALVMRPLLLHASSRTTGKRLRRVIHIEFAGASVMKLPGGLRWAITGEGGAV